MTLNIAADRITSDEVEDVAEFGRIAANGKPCWTVTGPALSRTYGRRLFGRNQAVSAMTLAEELARPNPDTALVADLRGELK